MTKRTKKKNKLDVRAGGSLTNMLDLAIEIGVNNREKA